MPLSDSFIRAALDSGTWTATRNGQPVTVADLTVNPNSVNLSVGHRFLMIDPKADYIDLHDPDSFTANETNRGDVVLFPGNLYLASVREAFDCSAPLWIPRSERVYFDEARLVFDEIETEAQTFFIPCVEGRSTVARVGLSIHECAGFGDYGFDAAFTLELRVTHPLRLRTGDEIAQIVFVPVAGTPAQRYQSVYAAQDGPTPARLGRERFQRHEEAR